MKETPMDKMTFEEALQMLEKEAERLRSGELGLEESVSVYNNSILLYKHCRAILDNAKQKIEIYRPQDGSTEDFDA